MEDRDAMIPPQSSLIVLNPVGCLVTFEPSNARRSGQGRPLARFGCRSVRFGFREIHPSDLLSVIIGRPSFGCRLPIIGSGVKNSWELASFASKFPLRISPDRISAPRSVSICVHLCPSVVKTFSLRTPNESCCIQVNRAKSSHMVCVVPAGPCQLLQTA
jgi:hypothetical protein